MSTKFKLTTVSHPKDPLIGGSKYIEYEYNLSLMHVNNDFDLKNFISSNNFELYCRSISSMNKRLDIIFTKTPEFIYNKKTNRYIIRIFLAFRSTTRGMKQPLIFFLCKKEKDNLTVLAKTAINIEVISIPTHRKSLPIKTEEVKRIPIDDIHSDIVKEVVSLPAEKKLSILAHLLKQCFEDQQIIA